MGWGIGNTSSPARTHPPAPSPAAAAGRGARSSGAGGKRYIYKIVATRRNSFRCEVLARQSAAVPAGGANDQGDDPL